MTAFRIAAVALYLFTLASAYAGLVPPSVWSTPAILVLLFPYLAITTGVVSAAWFLTGRWITGALGVLTLILCWGPLGMAVPAGHEREAKAGEGPGFTILTYNILHAQDIGGGPDGNSALEYVLHSGADIVVLQEMERFGSRAETPKFPGALKDSLESAYPYIITGKYDNDLSVLSKYPVRMADLGAVPSHSYFYEAYEVMIRGKRLTLFNVHLTSFNLSEGEREIVEDIRGVRSARSSLAEFKGTVMGKLKAGFAGRASTAIALRGALSQAEGPLVVCGDFNDVPASWVYRTVRGEDLKDAYAETNIGLAITFNAHYFWFHLDQILYRGPLKALRVKRGDIKASDHYPQLASFVFTR